MLSTSSFLDPISHGHELFYQALQRSTSRVQDAILEIDRIPSNLQSHCIAKSPTKIFGETFKELNSKELKEGNALRAFLYNKYNNPRRWKQFVHKILNSDFASSEGLKWQNLKVTLISLRNTPLILDMNPSLLEAGKKHLESVSDVEPLIYGIKNKLITLINKVLENKASWSDLEELPALVEMSIPKEWFDVEPLDKILKKLVVIQSTLQISKKEIPPLKIKNQVPYEKKMIKASKGECCCYQLLKKIYDYIFFVWNAIINCVKN